MSATPAHALLRPDPEGQAEAAPGPAAPHALARIPPLVSAALLLAWPAAWNGYPLVFADTGTYLGQTLLLYLGWDRPPFYSLFLYATHWRLSLWLPVLVQALLVAHLLGLVLRVQGLGGPVPLLVASLALAALTSLPWLVAQLLPDLFTGVLVLALWLLGFRAPLLGRGERLWLMLLAAGSVAMHQSHIPLAFGLVLLGAALLLPRALAGQRRAALFAALRMLVPVLLATLAILSMNLAAHHRFGLSPYGSVFLATRLIYDGPGRAHIARACDAGAPLAICAVEDRLPPHHNAFLWYPDSPLYGVLGGPKAWSGEARAIVRGTLAEAPGAVVAAMLRNALAQLGMMRTGDGLEPWPATPGPAPLIARYFRAEQEGFRTARQQQGLLRPEAEALGHLHVALAALGALALLVLLGRRLRDRRDLPGAALAVFVLAALPGNAAVTGALSGPAHRYQARLSWLLVLAPAAIALPSRLSRSSDRAAAGAAAPAASAASAGRAPPG